MFDSEPSRWDAFVARSRHRSVFAYSAFLRSLRTRFSLVTCEEGGSIVAGAPILLGEDGNPLTEVHPFTLYQGLMHADAADAPAHRRLKHELDATEFFAAGLLKRFRQCCLVQHWRFDDLRGFLWYHYHEKDLERFRVVLAHAGILDLSQYASFDDYVASVRKVRRYEARKASKVEIRTSLDVALLDELHDKTFARQGLSRSEEEARTLISITRAALAGGYGRLNIAYVEGQPASAALFLYDDRAAYYLFGANAPEFRDSGASTVLMLHMIRETMDRGLMEVDFVGVNSPSRGDYKISFNADVRRYIVLRYGV